MDRNNASTSLKALERSTYRSLQKTAKLLCLPANVKKSCLINLIYTKTHKSEYDLDILVEAIKQERATYSAHCKTKQGHLIQAAEISSTSSIKSPIRHTSRYLRQSPIRYSPENSVSSKPRNVSKTITKVASPSQKKSITNQTSSYKSPNVNLGKYYTPKTKSRLNVSESQNMHTTLNSYRNITSGRKLRSDHKSMEVVNINNVVNGSAREVIRREENKKTILTVVGTNGTKRIRLTAYKKSDKVERINKVEDNKKEVVQVTNEKTPTSTRKRKISGISPLTSPHTASTQQQTTANNTPDLSLDLLGSDLCNTEHILSESALHESFPNLSAVTDDLDSTIEFDVFNATVEPPRRQDGVYSAHQPTTTSGAFDTQLVYTAQATVTSVAQVLDTCTENNASCQRADNACYPNGAGCLTLYELWNNGDHTALQQELICREMMAVSPFDFLGIQDLGANVTVPELVEDAMELISQDGDYLERIDMEYKLQCILCDWNGPKFMLEFHIRQDHSSDILKTNTKNWNITYTLGSLTKDQWISNVTEYNTKLYVLSAKCQDSDKLMASLNVLSYEENENILKGKITIYNKITGDPVEWSGNILQYPDNQPIRYQDNCLTTSLKKLNVLSERESLNKLSTTQRHLYDIQITFFIDLY